MKFIFNVKTLKSTRFHETLHLPFESARAELREPRPTPRLRAVLRAAPKVGAAWWLDVVYVGDVGVSKSEQEVSDDVEHYVGSESGGSVHRDADPSVLGDFSADGITDGDCESDDETVDKSSGGQIATDQGADWEARHGLVKPALALHRPTPSVALLKVTAQIQRRECSSAWNTRRLLGLAKTSSWRERARHSKSWQLFVCLAGVCNV